MCIGAPVSQSSVYIVLATFNGERHLLDQIRSIQSQSFNNWTLLVSDDGSGDGSLDVIRELKREDPRIELLPSRGGQAGHVGNFEYLLNEVMLRRGEYVFLADQDDVWEPDKLETLLALAKQDPEQISVVFSDLWMIDASGNRLGSFMQLHGFSGHYDTANMLRANFAVGCSMVVAADLLNIALPFPPGLENHDWWLGLCAVSLGQLGFSPRKLVNYRQHADNAIGVRSYRTQFFRLSSILRRQRRVFESKITAVDELVRRLQESGARPPEALIAWQNQFSDADRWQKPWKLLTSEFKPGSRALLLIQLLAVSPFIGGKIKKTL